MSDTVSTSRLPNESQAERIALALENIARLRNDETGFSTAPDSYLPDLIALADAGEIDLHDDLGWTVGDIRKVVCDGFTVEYILTDPGHYRLTTPTVGGRTTCNFTMIPVTPIATEESQIAYAKMNDGINTARMLDTTFIPKLPSGFLSILKKYTKYESYSRTASSNDSLDIVSSVWKEPQETSGMGFLPAAVEVYGDDLENAAPGCMRVMANDEPLWVELSDNDGKLSQLDFFKTPMNRQITFLTSSGYSHYYYNPGSHAGLINYPSGLNAGGLGAGDGAATLAYYPAMPVLCC